MKERLYTLPYLLDFEIVGCFFDDQEIRLEPKYAQYPDIDVLSSGSKA